MSNQMWKHFAEDGDMDKKLKQNIFFSDFRFFRKNKSVFEGEKIEKVGKMWKNIF